MSPAKEEATSGFAPKKSIILGRAKLLHKQILGENSGIRAGTIEDVIGFLAGDVRNRQPISMVLGSSEQNHHYVWHINTELLPSEPKQALPQINSIIGFELDFLEYVIDSFCVGVFNENFRHNLDGILREIMIMADPSLGYSPQQGVYSEFTADHERIELVINSRADSKKATVCSLKEKGGGLNPLRILKAKMAVLGEKKYNHLLRLTKAILTHELPKQKSTYLPKPADLYLVNIPPLSLDGAIDFLRCLPTATQNAEKRFGKETADAAGAVLLNLTDLFGGLLKECEDNTHPSNHLFGDMRTLAKLLKVDLLGAYQTLEMFRPDAEMLLQGKYAEDLIPDFMADHKKRQDKANAIRNSVQEAYERMCKGLMMQPQELFFNGQRSGIYGSQKGKPMEQLALQSPMG